MLKQRLRATGARRWLTYSLRILVFVTIAGIALPLVSTAIHLGIPAPSGEHAIGRLRLSWQDKARHEVLTPADADYREVIAEVWYPAEAHTGRGAAYLPELDRISAGLVQSGEVNRLQAWGLKFVRAHGRLGASPAATPAPYPVVLLSPGNATNAEFYASFAEDLASHGLVVVAINHPYDVAAVALADGSVATLTTPDQPRPEYTAARVEERVADVRFLLDRLADLNRGAGPLAQRLDLARIGIMGHSLGGITAAQACARDSRLKACVNLDGIQNGGPFSVKAGEPIPSQPFLFITKETTLFPALEQLLQGIPNFSRVVIAKAAHRDFSDGPLFEPSFTPFSRTIDRVNGKIRQALLDFFQNEL